RRARGERLHLHGYLLPVDPAKGERLADRQGLHLALGYRLVLVLEALWGSDSCHTALRQAGAELAHLSTSDAAVPEAPAGFEELRERDSGRRHADRARRGIPRVSAPGDRHLAGMGVPVPDLGPELRFMPAGGKPDVCELWILGHGPHHAPDGTLQPDDRESDRRTRRCEGTVLGVLLRSGDVL